MSKDQDMVSREDYDLALNKLEVAKGFLQDLDNKLSKYEAVELDALIQNLEKYESIGTVEDLIKLKAESSTQTVVKNETETTKDDSAQYDDTEDGDKNKCKDSEGKNTSETTDEESEEMTPEQKAKMEAYIALGTPEDIQKAFAKMESLLDDHGSLATITGNLEKMESLSSQNDELTAKLESYLEVGTVPEILKVCDEYASMKTKQESERIAKDLNIPVDKVESAINKMESVADAESFLKDLFSKHESETTHTQKEDGELVEKLESESVNLLNGNRTKLREKNESENLTKLGQIIRKL